MLRLLLLPASASISCILFLLGRIDLKAGVFSGGNDDDDDGGGGGDGFEGEIFEI